eukprot:705054-Amphidinium_carterae.1
MLPLVVLHGLLPAPHKQGIAKVWFPASMLSELVAGEERVEPVDLQGSRMADVAANKGTSEHVPREPSSEWKQWSTVCQAV